MSAKSGAGGRCSTLYGQLQWRCRLSKISAGALLGVGEREGGVAGPSSTIERGGRGKRGIGCCVREAEGAPAGLAASHTNLRSLGGFL
jgi:hypothetical protein